MCPHLLRAEVVLGSGCLMLTLGKALGGTETRCAVPDILHKPPFDRIAATLHDPVALTAGGSGRFQFYTFLNPVPGCRDALASQGARRRKRTKAARWASLTPLKPEGAVPTTPSQGEQIDVRSPGYPLSLGWNLLMGFPACA